MWQVCLPECVLLQAGRDQVLEVMTVKTLLLNEHHQPLSCTVMIGL